MALANWWRLRQTRLHPKQFQKKEFPFKVTDLWVEVQKLLSLNNLFFSVWWAQLCLNPLTSFFCILDAVFPNMNFVNFLIAWKKMKCDDKYYSQVLFDLEGIWHSPVSHILLQLYSNYFIRHLICYIWVLREIRAKLPELDHRQGGRSIVYFLMWGPCQ